MNTHRYTTTIVMVFFCLTGQLFPHTVTAHLNGQTQFGRTVSYDPTTNSNNSCLIENKGLNAWELAQTRTVAARLRFMDRQRNAKLAIQKANAVIATSKTQIRKSKELLAANTKNGELSDADIKRQTDNIRRAEIKLRELEKTIQYSLKMKNEKSM